MDVTVFYPYSTLSFLIPINFLRKPGRKKKTQLLGLYIKWSKRGTRVQSVRRPWLSEPSPALTRPKAGVPLDSCAGGLLVTAWAWPWLSSTPSYLCLSTGACGPAFWRPGDGGGVLLRPRLWAGLCSQARVPPAGPGGDFVPLCPVGTEGLPGTLKRGFLSLGIPFPP